MDLEKFSGYTFLGSLLWNAELVFAGFCAGANWHSITSIYYGLVTAVVLVLVVVVPILVLRSMRIIRPAQLK